MYVTCLFRTATKQRRCALSDTLSARVLLGDPVLRQHCHAHRPTQTCKTLLRRSLANLNSPGSEAGTKSEAKISLLFVPVAVAGGILTGTMAEWLLTDIDIAPSELIPVWLISPISLTVGGGHFPFPDYFRPLTSILGLLTFPALIAAIVFACR